MPEISRPFWLLEPLEWCGGREPPRATEWEATDGQTSTTRLNECLWKRRAIFEGRKKGA